MSSFIGIYDNVISQKDCDILISYFEKSEQAPGRCVVSDGSHEIIPAMKMSKELCGCDLSKVDPVSTIIKSPLKLCLERYKKKYSNSLDSANLCKWLYDDRYTFKKYATEYDGFKQWHTEHVPGALQRIGVWMFYLNNAKSGTEFMYYPNVRAKMGRCVIWPSGWTHMHRSQLPNKGLKYFISGWFSYI